MSDPNADAALRLATWLTPGIDVRVFELAAEVIGEVIDGPVELVELNGASGPLPDTDPFAAGEFDLGWMCSTAYVQQRSVELVGIAWAPDDPDLDGEALYFSDLVVADPAVVSGLDDLAGRVVGCNDPMSLSGHYGLSFVLEDRGERLGDSVEPIFTGGHLQSLEALDEGRVDAAVIDSVIRLVHRPEVPLASRLGPWPTQPLVAGPTVDAPTRLAIRAALLSAHERPGASSVFAEAGLTRFVSVDRSLYADVARRFEDGPR